MLEVRNNKSNLLYDNKISKEYKVKLRKIKKGEKISIVADTMFRTMFNNEKRIKYSTKLISYFLDIRYEELLKKIKLAKNEIDKERDYSKGQRCDYIAEIGDTIINIEVNNNSDCKVMERNMDYAYKLYAKNIKRGEEYEYNQIIQFNLNNFSFEGKDHIIEIYKVQNEDKVVLNDKIVFIQIYIPNLRKKWYTFGIESLDERERYLLALVEENMEEVEKFGDENVMKDYIKEAEKVSFEGQIEKSYDYELSSEYESFKEGKEEGKKENSKKIAQAMLEKGMEKELISELTSLPLNEIESL